MRGVKKSRNASKRISLVSLGCPKNLVDSEIILGMLAQAGYAITSQPEDSEIIIINTCSFIEAAVRESLQTILELAQIKEHGPCRFLVVCGCLPQRYKHKLTHLLSEVDLFVGPGGFSLLPELLRDLDEKKGISRLHISTPSFIPDIAIPRLPSTLHMAYVKIADGCSNVCSYCTIPQIRGSFRSRSIDSIIQEVTQLANMGVKEVNVVAHDTTAYGLDLPGSPGLKDLLRALSSINGIRWIRILYAHPKRITKSLIEAIRDNNKVINYLDIPIQHINPDILKAMNRPYNDYYIRNLIDRLRKAMPHIVLRTTLMVGFPHETDKVFQELVDFVKEIQFDHLGVFKYSKEGGTKAATFEGHIPEKVKELRYRTLMELQAQISLSKNRSLVGTTQEVIIEEGDNRVGAPLKGRTSHQAPDIDGIVYITKGSGAIGDIVDVTITEACAYDLIGEVKGKIF